MVLASLASGMKTEAIKQATETRKARPTSNVTMLKGTPIAAPLTGSINSKTKLPYSIHIATPHAADKNRRAIRVGRRISMADQNSIAPAIKSSSTKGRGWPPSQDRSPYEQRAQHRQSTQDLHSTSPVDEARSAFGTLVFSPSNSWHRPGKNWHYRPCSGITDLCRDASHSKPIEAKAIRSAPNIGQVQLLAKPACSIASLTTPMA